MFPMIAPPRSAARSQRGGAGRTLAPRCSCRHFGADDFPECRARVVRGQGEGRHSAAQATSEAKASTSPPSSGICCHFPPFSYFRFSARDVVSPRPRGRQWRGAAGAAGAAGRCAGEFLQSTAEVFAAVRILTTIAVIKAQARKTEPAGMEWRPVAALLHPTRPATAVIRARPGRRAV